MKRKEETMILAEEAFWALLGEGKPPTVDLINGWLEGRGHERRDRNLVNQVSKACWIKVGDRVRTNFTLPGIPEATVKLFVKLHEDLAAVARSELDAERADIEAAAAARVRTVEDELARARVEAEQAKSAQRESAAAFDTLKAERDQLRLDLHEAHILIDVERAQVSKVQTELASALASAAVRAAGEKERFETLQQTADSERKRQANEIDALRTELRGLKDDARKLQKLAEEASQRERELNERNASLGEQLGTAKGAERVQLAQIAELTRTVEQLRNTVSEQAHEMSRLGTDLARAQTLAQERPHITMEQLAAALAQAWLGGATNPGKPVRGEDPAAALAARADRYATKELKVLGASRS
ncbi:hypothetical protein R70006_06233 [Paraburkholderia domus]|uniref:hypothetical protein n=1 Tax=Paraburkholderia domus TaxID=2793075 RepID=UPI0019129830|nr:hypothetical protein [Paraburkholderia domus]MBK5052864.1 hypothetical protein [Burkholderia sp. R-70006]CAE6821727.1 hypothetical protein R70006_06233 [Paraburkholderia domus]